MSITREFRQDILKIIFNIGLYHQNLVINQEVQ